MKQSASAEAKSGSIIFVYVFVISCLRGL